MLCVLSMVKISLEMRRICNKLHLSRNSIGTIILLRSLALRSVQNTAMIACLKGMLIFLLVAFTLERATSSTLHLLYLKASKRLRIGVVQRVLKSGLTSSCFYHIIKTLREYPDAPELSTVTSKVAKDVDFRSTSSELAFLIHDAMRSVYGKDFINNPEQCSRIAFAMDMPKDYKGNETLAIDCENVTDEYIMDEWRRVAACRFKERGPVFPT